MLTLYRENGVLFAQCLLNLRRDIHYKNQVFKAGKKNEEDLVEIDAIYEILRVNGNIKFFNGEKYIKLNLGQFSHLILNNKYLVEEIPEIKVEKVEVEMKPKEEPKKMIKKEVVVEDKPMESSAPNSEEELQGRLAEAVKYEKENEEVKPKEEPKKVAEEVKENENKKKRHKNTNNQN